MFLSPNLNLTLVTSPIGLLTPVLLFDRRHLRFLEPEVTICGQEGGANPKAWLAWCVYG